MSNTYYCDYSDAIAPILEALYTRWFDWSLFPASFEEENIKCLKKNASYSLPLDHLQIAPFNSDYKLFTNVISFRARPLLSQTFLLAKFGFVSKRSIHTAIDISAAFPKNSELGLQYAWFHRTSPCVRYGLRHAATSIFYLSAGMARLLLSIHIGSGCIFLHHDTTCRFVVSGYRSSSRDVRRGIRQGFPLAPYSLYWLSIVSIG